MSDTIQNVFAVLGTLFNMVITMMFYKACFGKHNIRVNATIFYIAYIAAYAAGIALSQFGSTWIFYTARSEVIFFSLTLLYSSRWVTRFFASLSYLVFGMISEVISYGIILATFTNTPDEDLQYYSLLLSKIIMLVITVAVMLIIKRNTDIVRVRDYMCFIVTPLISIATLITISFEFDTGAPNAAAGICFAAVGLMIINIIVYYLLENITEATEIKEKQRRMEQQFAFQEQKYEQASQSFRQISGVIHDTNKHLVYLGECVERGEYDEAKSYIASSIEHIDKSYKRINTGFLPIDSLVSNALNIAEASGITFMSSIKIEKERIKIERYDLCVALGNLLDNAVEACRKVPNPDDRNISVTILTADGSLIVNIVNSAFRCESRELKTDKKNKLLHGYGIINVRAISEKYGGVFTIDRKEASCETTLIFPID